MTQIEIDQVVENKQSELTADSRGNLNTAALFLPLGIVVELMSTALMVVSVLTAGSASQETHPLIGPTLGMITGAIILALGIGQFGELIKNQNLLYASYQMDKQKFLEMYDNRKNPSK